MKSNTICQVILAGSIILASCQSNNSAKQDESQQTMNENSYEQSYRLQNQCGKHHFH